MKFRDMIKDYDVLKNREERKNKGITEFYRDNEGEYRWRITASTGDNIANCGQGYKNKKDCINGLDSVKWHIVHSDVMENW